MTTKLSISLTDEQAKLVQAAVDSGQYASASEVVREALRRWRTAEIIGRLWDEGIASGLADPDETIDDIKRAARLELRRKQDASPAGSKAGRRPGRAR